ncbi:MAG: HIT family protein [Candidatus Paceibacterota bacterium]|jgi:histidine triad (HIT) family protein
MEDCLFCKIAAGQIPSAKICETEKSFAFLDINPIRPGHTLVIPKKHSKNIFEINEDDLTDVVKTVKRVAIAVQESLGAKGVNVLNRNNAVAGQAVPHLHFHVVPRNVSDGLETWHGKKYSDGEMEKTAATIKKLIDPTFE